VTALIAASSEWLDSEREEKIPGRARAKAGREKIIVGDEE
jgi:hypothetical protein